MNTTVSSKNFNSVLFWCLNGLLGGKTLVENTEYSPLYPFQHIGNLDVSLKIKHFPILKQLVYCNLKAENLRVAKGHLHGNFFFILLANKQFPELSKFFLYMIIKAPSSPRIKFWFSNFSDRFHGFLIVERSSSAENFFSK